MAEMNWQEALLYQAQKNKEYVDGKMVSGGGISEDQMREVNRIFNADGSFPSGKVWMSTENGAEWAPFPSGGTSSGSTLLDNPYVFPEDFLNGGSFSSETDLHKAMQDAIDYASANGKVVRLTAPIYKIRNTLILRSNTKIVGADSAKGGNAAVRIYNKDSDVFQFEDGASAIAIDNLYIQGSSARGFKVFGHPAMTYVSLVAIRNVGIYGFDAVFDNIAFTYAIIKEINATSINRLGAFSGADSVFAEWNASTDSATVRSDYMLAATTNICRFEHIFFTSSKGGGTGSVNIMKLVGKGNVVSGCWFDYADGIGLLIHSASNYNRITGNMFRGLGKDGTSAFLRVDGHDNAISENSFLEVHTGNPSAVTVPSILLSTASKNNFVYANLLEISNSVKDSGVSNTVGFGSSNSSGGNSSGGDSGGSSGSGSGSTTDTTPDEISKSIGTDGNVYNGKGYKEGFRLNSSGAETSDSDSMVTGFIPVSVGDVFTIANSTLSAATTEYDYVTFYNSSFASVKSKYPSVYMGEGTSGFTIDMEANSEGYVTSIKCTRLSSDTAYMRISTADLTRTKITRGA